MSNEVEIVISSKNKVKEGLNEARGDTKRFARETEDTIGKSGDKAGSSFKSGLSGKFKALPALGATAGLAVGASLGTALMGALSSALDKRSAMTKLSAQLANPGMAKKAGEAAGAVYKEGFGESFADVADIARRALQSGVAKAPEDIKAVTRAASSLAETFDVDVRESMAAAQALMANGLAKDGPAAFDLISKAMTNTGDLSDDLMDTITEYSTQFRALGLSAPKALGMIDQMVKAGARNTDLAADALKEFAIRSKDGSDTSTSAFKALGLNAKQMFQTFSAGGKNADKAMLDVITRLKAVKDPAERTGLAIDLFGTQAEDLQDSLYAIDPTTAVAAFGKVEGSAKKMGDTLASDPKKKIEAMKRAVTSGLSSMAGKAIGIFEDLGKDPAIRDSFGDLDTKAMPILRKVGKFISEKLGPFFKDVLGSAVKSVSKAFGRLSDAVKDNEPELKTLYKWMNKIADFVSEKLGPIMGKYLVNNITMAINILSAIIHVIGSVIRTFNRLKDGASSAASGVKSRFSSMASYVRSIPGRISGAISSMFRGIPAAARSAVATAKNILAGLVSYARSIPGKVKSTITSGISGIMDKLPHFAHGGVVGAASGGPRNGLIEINEHGRELVRLPSGSTVLPHANTQTIMGGARGGGGGGMTLEFRSSGGRVENFLVEILREAVRGRGGNVQAVLGS